MNVVYWIAMMYGGVTVMSGVAEMTTGAGMSGIFYVISGILLFFVTCDAMERKKHLELIQEREAQEKKQSSEG